MKIKKAFVLGAGIMGTGIAQLMSQNNLEVILVDIDESILKKSVERIEKGLGKRVAAGKMAQEELQGIIDRIEISTQLEKAANADFIIESVVEKVSLKQKVFQELEEVAPAEVILATNTTACSISEIASATKDPSRVVGMHFFNPPFIMKLVEIMPGLATSPQVVDETRILAEQLGRKPVVTIKEGIAGIVSRVLGSLLNEAVWILEEGIAGIEEIDQAMKLGANLPMGPLQLIDFIGIDTHLAKTRTLYEKLGDARYRPCYLLEKMMHAGYLGRKSKKGFYDYTQDPPVPVTIK